MQQNEKINAMIYEIGIDYRNRFLIRRVFRTVRSPVSMVFLVLCLFSVVKGISVISFLYLFGSLVMILLAYSYFFTYKMLFNFRYVVKEDRIEILAFKNNQIIEVFVGRKRDINVTIRQNYSSRDTLFTLTFYHKRKAIFRQNERYGWSLEMFQQIENILKSY